MLADMSSAILAAQQTRRPLAVHAMLFRGLAGSEAERTTELTVENSDDFLSPLTRGQGFSDVELDVTDHEPAPGYRRQP